MKNKYSELSDFEINKLIADSIGYEYEIAVCFPDPPPQNELDYQYINKKVTSNKKFWARMDYCKNYKDAMHLTIDNKISLRFLSMDNKWGAVGSVNSIIRKGCCHSATHKKPCRAIAECYLLIKDAENGQKLR